MRHLRRAVAGGATAVALAAAIAAGEWTARAADHLDPPTRTDPDKDATPDFAADITDVYAWHTATSVIIAFNFSGPQATTLPARYDRDVLYTLNIATGPNKAVATYPVRFRFGADRRSGTPQYGIQVSGLPGVTGMIEGPVETTLTKDGVMVRAGLYDDPFFFDLQGFRTTTATGTFSFDSKRNFFAGQNLTSVVFEIPRARLETGNPIGIWVTTARFGGQI